MSCNRENVIWENEDGRWSIGFFDYYEVNTDSPNWDYEWDVEYDFSRFNWVSTGHATKDRAADSWGGSNPGGHIICRYSDQTKDEIAEYNRMAREWKEEERRKDKEYGVTVRLY